MDKTERDIMTAAYRFLESYTDKLPDADTPFNVAWWDRTCEAVTAAWKPYEGHPLADAVFPSVYFYLEDKQKGKVAGWKPTEQTKGA